MKANWLLKFQYAAIFGAMIYVAPSVDADTPAFVLGEVLDTQPVSFTGTRGWMFFVGGEDILITQLGVFDAGGDGLINSHEIGLWRRDDNLSGTLLASATVPAGTEAPLEGGYRWISIDPILIPLSTELESFVVAAQFTANDPDDLVTPRPSGTVGNFEFAPEIGPFTAAGRATPADQLSYPAGFFSCGEGCTPEIFWEPNLQYRVVPEPSVGLLLIPGLVLLFRKLKNNREASKVRCPRDGP